MNKDVREREREREREKENERDQEIIGEKRDKDTLRMADARLH